MNLGMQANIGQTQEQTLSPALLQSVKMLQKTSQELETAIKEEVEVNPLLEVDDGDFDDQEVPVDKDPEELDPRADSDEYPDDIEDMARGSLDDTADVDSSYLDGESSDVNWDSYLGDGTSYDDAPFNDLNSGGKDPDEDWDRPIKDVGKSLQEQLEDQLRLWNGTRELQEQLQENGVTEEHFRKLVQYLINSINDDGFLCDANRDNESEAMVVQSDDKYIDEIERVLRGELKLEDASLPVREAVHVLQSFKPSGIGARDQRECFLIQAYAIPNFPSLAIRILEEEYENLLQLRYAKIAKALNVSADEVKMAVASLSRLRPHPGFQLSHSYSHIINADLKVVEKKGNYEVVCFKTKMQKSLRINQTYKAILTDPSASKQDKEYVKAQLAKATDLIKAVDNRFSTIELVMRAIVKRQRGFFENGPAFLKPMILQDVADDVHLAVSTVQRATDQKYVETPYGMYELKQFFTSGVKQGSAPDAEEVGSAQIIDAIKTLIDEEDKSSPLSDQDISDELLKQGIKVARRTVAKYREKELKILPKNQRKR
ncbi:RNA polymerase factor sigma-54 [Fibrobacter succinogenes]|uniref:RNA polymerase, sigma 54 subunit, RpoN/SigL n=1 Tax=Fibrobacter succinogenes TaxID=833 RepID=A0A380S609_FIBSU|nr:RNA polymerase factor sigma-54 [Fibrobacter succinogenes]PWJ35778.1 RNA polymerase RpoN-/SigL-like sigma 54 subunit [Fibrobacter succinogenes subsp. elongatus]SUQ24433.1 RNA polymerase, sigma 54 subunit, RpoN/SigL [Fibrobacter succinogenes]